MVMKYGDLYLECRRALMQTEDAQTAANSMTQSAEYAEKQNELIEATGEKLLDIKKDTDILHNGVVQVNESVENIIQANVIIMDSITNLSTFI